MWKEAAVAKFKVLARHLPELTGKNHEKLRMACVLALIWTQDPQMQTIQPLLSV